jgi:hypothetical protein
MYSTDTGPIFGAPYSEGFINYFENEIDQKTILELYVCALIKTFSNDLGITEDYLGPKEFWSYKLRM